MSLEDTFEEYNNHCTAQDPEKRTKHSYSFLIIVIIVLIATCFTYIPPGNEGVKVSKISGVQDDVLTPGLHPKLSILESVEYTSTRTQIKNVNTAACSKDMQDVSTAIALNYRLVPGKIPWIYQNMGFGYEELVITPAVEESTKAATAKYTAAELITKRPTVKEDITANIKSRLLEYNIVVEQVSITNFNFSADYTKAIEQKQIAEQNAEKAQRDLERIKIEAEQRVTQASAEANATKLQGEANAYSIDVMGKALKDNPDVAQIKWIEKWNGELPFYMTSADNGNMMLIDTKV